MSPNSYIPASCEKKIELRQKESKIAWWNSSAPILSKFAPGKSRIERRRNIMHLNIFQTTKAGAVHKLRWQIFSLFDPPPSFHWLKPLLARSLFVCLYRPWILHPEWIIHPMLEFIGFSLKPKVFGIGNTPFINPWIGGGKGSEQTSSDSYFPMPVDKSNTKSAVI